MVSCGVPVGSFLRVGSGRLDRTLLQFSIFKFKGFADNDIRYYSSQYCCTGMLLELLRSLGPSCECTRSWCTQGKPLGCRTHQYLWGQSLRQRGAKRPPRVPRTGIPKASPDAVRKAAWQHQLTNQPIPVSRTISVTAPLLGILSVSDLALHPQQRAHSPLRRQALSQHAHACGRVSSC